MSIGLDSTPAVGVFTDNLSNEDGSTVVVIGGIRIPMLEFRHMVVYVMCNTHIVPDDQRLALLEDVRSLTLVERPDGRRVLVGLRSMAKMHAFSDSTPLTQLTPVDEKFSIVLGG